jgi:hypothetical protein
MTVIITGRSFVKFQKSIEVFQRLSFLLNVDIQKESIPALVMSAVNVKIQLLGIVL